jgi:hypothetical protein
MRKGVSPSVADRIWIDNVCNVSVHVFMQRRIPAVHGFGRDIKLPGQDLGIRRWHARRLCRWSWRHGLLFDGPLAHRGSIASDLFIER